MESIARNAGSQARGDGYTAAMESIAATISDHERNTGNNALKLEDLNPTKNSEDDSQYPGMRRLG
tara:strand:+ start:222 stop:416 length:195 start_codon:yes stop_codon:yes gene_type:complete